MILYIITYIISLNMHIDIILGDFCLELFFLSFAVGLHDSWHSWTQESCPKDISWWEIFDIVLSASSPSPSKQKLACFWKVWD